MGNEPMNLIDIIPICFSNIYSFLILLIRYRRMSHRNEKFSPLTGLLQKKKFPKTKSYIVVFLKIMIPSICLFCKNIPWCMFFPMILTVSLLLYLCTSFIIFFPCNLLLFFHSSLMLCVTMLLTLMSQPGTEKRSICECFQSLFLWLLLSMILL